MFTLVGHYYLTNPPLHPQLREPQILHQESRSTTASLRSLHSASPPTAVTCQVPSAPFSFLGSRHCQARIQGYSSFAPNF